MKSLVSVIKKESLGKRPRGLFYRDIGWMSRYKDRTNPESCGQRHKLPPKRQGSKYCRLWYGSTERRYRGFESAHPSCLVRVTHNRLTNGSSE